MNNHDDNLLESLLAITPEQVAAYQAAQAARDQDLAQAFEELAEMPPEPYHVKQHRRYQQAVALGDQERATDWIWRAAGVLNLLTAADDRPSDLTPARIQELIAALGW